MQSAWEGMLYSDMGGVGKGQTRRMEKYKVKIEHKNIPNTIKHKKAGACPRGPAV